MSSPTFKIWMAIEYCSNEDEDDCQDIGPWPMCLGTFDNLGDVLAQAEAIVACHHDDEWNRKDLAGLASWTPD